MNYKSFTAALDIGSAQLTLALGTRTTQGEINVIDCESVPSSYLRQGKIINESAVAKEIQALVLKVQQRQKAIIERIYVSTSGTFLFSERININKALGEGSIVTQEIIDGLNNREELEKEVNNYATVYKSAVCYRLDGEKESAPVGHRCQRIEADFLTIKGNEDSIERIKKTLELAEINMAEMFLSPIVVAEATLNQEEKQHGAAAIEIGNASSKVAIYKDGILQYAICIPLGSQLIINDLSSILNISYAVAEKILKNEKFGAVCASLVEDAEMELMTKNDIKKIFPTRFIVEVIEARLEEILLNIKHHLEKSGFMYLMSSGLVLSGRITSVKNLCHFVTLKTNINARIANSSQCSSSVESLTSNLNNAEICGLLSLGKGNCKKEEKLEKQESTPVAETPKPKQEKPKESRIKRGMRSLFEGMFDEEDTSLD